jgi:dynein heavy chain
MLPYLQATDQEPQVMWLSGLHVPESYLTALVQATCRKNAWPLDKSTLYTSVTTYAGPEDVAEHAHQGDCILMRVMVSYFSV